MILDGKHFPNITCKKCRHRHPEHITCAEAKKYADLQRKKQQDADAVIQSLLDERLKGAHSTSFQQLLERIEELEHIIEHVKTCDISKLCPDCQRMVNPIHIGKSEQELLSSIHGRRK